VAPLYVISNLTKSRLRVVQSYINSITEANDAILLVPDDRASFSWSNSSQPKLVKFIADGFQFWSPAFTLQDAGALSVQNIKQNGEKKFFKVTKKNQLGSVFIIIEDLVHPPYLIDN